VTGEFHWIKDIIDQYDVAARQKHLLIVPACGFDSIPSDIGVYFTVNCVREKFKTDCSKITNYVAANSKFSFGTLQSALSAMRDPKMKTLQKDVYALNPPDKKSGNDSLPRFRYDKKAKSWTIPFIMESVNARIVRRSAALLDYGKNFSYDEVVKTNFFIGLFLTILAPILVFLLSFKIVQQIVTPLASRGPTKEEMSKGFCSCKFVAQIEDNKEGTKYLETKVKFNYDGYLATAVFVCESAISIVLRRNELNPAGGVLTPAVAFGDVLVERLKKSRIEISCVEGNEDKKKQ